jgi:beta-galactosidase
LPPGPMAQLSAEQVHDFAWVFVNGKQVGVMDRRSQKFSVSIPERTAPAQLDILIEAMGRVNFGHEVLDHKGIAGAVSLQTGAASSVPLTDWSVFRLPLDETELASLSYQTGAVSGPAFWKGHFDSSEASDTFLDVHTWGKGVVWVNGHALGRFWNIGPTQTMFCPGPWLHKGSNEVVVLDLLGPMAPVMKGLTKPDLDEIHPELDFGYPSK